MKLFSKAMFATGVSAALLVSSVAAANAPAAPVDGTRVAGTIGVRQAISGVQRVNGAPDQSQNLIGGTYFIAILAALAAAGGIYAGVHHHHHGVSS